MGAEGETKVVGSDRGDSDSRGTWIQWFGAWWAWVMVRTSLSANERRRAVVGTPDTVVVDVFERTGKGAGVVWVGVEVEMAVAVSGGGWSWT